MPLDTMKNRRVIIDDGLIDSAAPHEITEPVWWTGDIYGTEEEYRASLKTFSRSQVLVFAALWYLGEVNNGGHDQFYFNSTGIVWPDALAAFKAFDLPEVAVIIDESTKRFGKPPSLSRDERGNALDSENPIFDDLDDRLFKLQEDRDLDSAMMDFVKTNRADFYFDGTVSIPE